MKIPYESPEAMQINEKIFECIYYTANKTSMELAKKDGPYKTFPGSPTSKGIL
jgi:ribonucleotide reductase alpha subunit